MGLNEAEGRKEHSVDVCERNEVTPVVVEDGSFEEAARNAKGEEHVIDGEDSQAVHGILKQVARGSAAAATLG